MEHEIIADQIASKARDAKYLNPQELKSIVLEVLRDQSYNPRTKCIDNQSEVIYSSTVNLFGMPNYELENTVFIALRILTECPCNSDHGFCLDILNHPVVTGDLQRKRLYERLLLSSRVADETAGSNYLKMVERLIQCDQSRQPNFKKWQGVRRGQHAPFKLAKSHPDLVRKIIMDMAHRQSPLNDADWDILRLLRREGCDQQTIFG